MSGRETLEVAPCPVCTTQTGYVDADGKTRCEECDEVLPY